MAHEVDIRADKDGTRYIPTGEFREPEQGEWYLTVKHGLVSPAYSGDRLTVARKGDRRREIVQLVDTEKAKLLTVRTDVGAAFREFMRAL